MELFPYQRKFYEGIYSSLRQHDRVCAVAPTGAGKTVVIAQICKDAVNRRRSVLILVHLDVLVPQTLEKLGKVGIHEDMVGCIKAGYPEDREALVQVASVQTLARRQWWREKDFKLIIFDEAHQTTFSKAGKKVLHQATGKVLGFTATPRRLAKREGLQDYYQSSLLAASHAELQEIGRLAKMKYYAIAGAKLDNVRTRGGDYVQGELSLACDDPELIQNIVDQWFKLCPGKRTIGFCVSVKHAEHVAEAFQQRGVSAAVVTGDTPIKQRHNLYEALERGELTVLASVNVVSIGFDCPAVEVGLGMRPTKSWALHFQQIGRVMRVAEGKEFGIWIDQAGNCTNRKLGLPEFLVASDYEMDASKDCEGGEVPVKRCAECGCINHAAAPICKACGYEFPKKIAYAPLGTYTELGSSDIKSYSPEARLYRRFLKQAYNSNYSPGWAVFKFRRHYELKHKTPPFIKREWRYQSVFGEFTVDNALAYFAYLQNIGQTRQKPPTWAQSEFKKEFPQPEAAKWLVQKVFDNIQVYQ